MLKDYCKQKNISFKEKPPVSKLNKTILFDRLKTYIETQKDYLKNKRSILKIQSAIRAYLRVKINKIRGPGFTDMSQCRNTEDFYYMTSYTEIDRDYFFHIKMIMIAFGFLMFEVFISYYL